MTKQEKIQEAWGDFYDKVKEKLTGEGYCNIVNMPHNIDLWDGKWDNYSTYYRPIELSGIDKNNNWTKIENENDLPKMIGSYFTYNGREVGIYHFENNDYWIRQWKFITHFQKINDPKLPIY